MSSSLLAAEALRLRVPWGEICGLGYGSQTASTRVLLVHGWLDNAASWYVLLLASVPGSVAGSHLVCLLQQGATDLSAAATWPQGCQSR